MNSVNTCPQDSTAIRVPNLYKKLGISNNIAIKPPLPKSNTSAKPKPRRQTLFVPSFHENLNTFQRSCTYKPKSHRSSASISEVEPTPIPLTRNQTPKSRFISNWILAKAKEKENNNNNAF